MTRFRSVCVLLALVVGPHAMAQTPTGTITGVARDVSGGVVAAVAVTVSSAGTGLARTVTTNQAGVYDNNDLGINQIVVPPSVDAIEQYKVQSSTYSAEYGRSGGGELIT